MTDIAPSLAAAFLGSLAFIAFVMWLRRDGDAGKTEARLSSLEQSLHDIAAAHGHTRSMAAGLATAISDLETKRLKLSKRLGEVEFKVLGSRRTPAEDEKGPGGA